MGEKWETFRERERGHHKSHQMFLRAKPVNRLLCIALALPEVRIWVFLSARGQGEFENTGFVFGVS
jgi:hypothetical protein